MATSKKGPRPRKAASPETPKRPARVRMSRDRDPVQRLTVRRGDESFEFNDRLPLLPLRDVVVYPYMTIPLLVGRMRPR